MKRFVLYFLKLICKIAYNIWPYKRAVRFKQLKVKAHTYWISSEFKSLGEKSSIRYPVVLKGGKYITIGNNTGLGERGVLTAWDKHGEQVFNPNISIGNNTSIGEEYHITAINKIQIGNNVLMGKKITITDNDHGETDTFSLSIVPTKRNFVSKGNVIIKDGVWIGDKVTILSNVTIGENSVIGANSVVTKDIPSNCVAGGIPAKILKNNIILERNF